MSNPTNIVVVVNRSADADYVLQKAAAIAASSPHGASVHVVRVMFEEFAHQTHMDEEQAQSLKLYLMQAEEEFLVDLVEDHRKNFTDLETATLWHKRVSAAVAEVAETFEADLIIKSADSESPHFPRHPDDWNLLREARCPVFLVKAEAWPAAPVVLAAVNITDFEHQSMNSRIIETGATLAKSMGGKLHVVNALPQTNPLLANAELGVDFVRLERELEQEIRGQLADTLSSLDVNDAQLHVLSGNAAGIVAEAAEKNDAAVVIVGTAGRKGVSAFILGNTSERLLHVLHQDLLVLHV